MIFEFLQNIAKSPLILSIFPILVTNLLTYYITKRSNKNEKLNEINKKSFELVYFPLIKKFRKIPTYDLANDESKKLYHSILTIYQNNEIYSNPILNRLLEEFIARIEKRKSTHNVIYRIHSHIINEYHKLRRKLNYPCISIFDILQYRSFGIIAISFGLIFILSFVLMLTFLGTAIHFKVNSDIITAITYLTLTPLLLFIFLIVICVAYYMIELFFNIILKRIRKKLFKH